METANNGYTWTNNKIQDEEEEKLSTVMEELERTLNECNNVELNEE